MYISQKYPKAPLLGLGFSVGGNIMTRYLAEEGEKSRLVAACVLACVRVLVDYSYQTFLTLAFNSLLALGSRQSDDGVSRLSLCHTRQSDLTNAECERVACVEPCTWEAWAATFSL